MSEPQRPFRAWSGPYRTSLRERLRQPAVAHSATAGAAATVPGFFESSGEAVADEDCGEDSYVGSARLAGRTALITGGDRGVGRAVAIAFAREGADVAIAYYDGHAGARHTVQLIRAAGRRGLAISGDLASAEHCRAVVARVVAQLDRPDILVNVATHRQTRDNLLRISPHELERTFRTNLFATIWLTQACLEHMKPGSVVINTGSVAAMKGDPSMIDFAASQGAVHALTRSLARSLLGRGVRVNCVAEGTTPPASDTGAMKPADFAPAYVLLASEEGRRWNGAVLTPSTLAGAAH